MPSPQFVHLHVHSDNSLLDGGSRTDQLVRRAKEFDMPALALTDHGVMYGAWEFQEQAKKEGIKPLIGMEAYVAPGHRTDREARSPTGKPYYHLVLIARNKTGYENLVKLTSRGFKEGFYYQPRLDRELLAEHSEGLICTSACLAGEVAQHIQTDDIEAAREAIEWHASVFRDRYYLEVQAHETEGQDALNRQIFELGDDMGLPIVATNDAHFLTPDHHEAHDVLICVGMAKDRDDPDRLRYDENLYMKSAEEIADFFPDRPDVLANTVEIAEQCDITFEKQYHVPEYPIDTETEEELARELEDEPASDEERRQALEARLLRELAYRGARERYGEDLSDEVVERLDYELDVITNTGYSGYFLITQDFIRWAKDHDIAVGPGRGSAAGSLVCYALDITDIDPLEYDLLFERFLNPDRVSMPDIDIDFDPEGRGEVIDYVRKRYGEESVGQIITFGTMKARAAIRDVGRVLDWDLGDVDKLAKLIPNDPGSALTIEEAIEQVGQVNKLYETEPRYRELLDYAKRLEGLRRHSSIHAAGVVIAPGPIDDYVPVAVDYNGSSADSDGTVLTQYDMNSLEKAGMLKMDFLGLKTLTVIGQARRMAEERHGVDIDFDELDWDDPATYEMIRAGQTAGIFQFESSLATDKLRAMQADRFDDLVATNALLRPGPLDSGMTDEYIDRKLGKKPVKYPHPELEEILEPTQGIIVYQEQVMRVAQVLAGYSLAEADVLRKAVGKKDAELIQKTLTEFRERCIANGVEKAKAEELSALIETFGRYGFNRSHSAAYSALAFQTAYLKAHYPHEFMAALLTSEIGDTDKIVQYMGEARQMGITVLPPDVSESGYRFTVVDTGEEGEPVVRFGLGAIRNVGEGVIREIMAARAEAPFTDFFDFVERAGPSLNSRVLEALINAGALDTLGANRAQMLAASEQALHEASRVRKEREQGQMNLFAGGGGEDADLGFELELPEVGELGVRDRLAREREALGLYVSGHPLEGREELARALATHEAKDIREDVPSDQEVRVAGVLTDVDQRVAAKSGNRYARCTLEDLTGSVELLVFERTLNRFEFLLEEGKLVVIEGRYNDDEDDPVMFANEIQSLSEAISQGGIGLKMRLEAGELDDQSSMQRVAEILSDHRGAAPVVVEVVRGGQSQLKSASSTIQPSRELLDELRALLGRDRIELAHLSGNRPERSSRRRSRSR